MNRGSRRVALVFLGLVCLLVAALAVLTWRVVQQERLDRALIAAVKRNDTRRVHGLLAQGADAQARDTAGVTRSVWSDLLNCLHIQRSVGNRSSAVLCVAIENGCDTAIVESLLDHGADPNSEGAEGQTALWVARDESATRSLDVVTPLLIRHHANVNRLRPGSEGRTLLMNAGGWGDETDIGLLLRAGAQINAQNTDGETALIYAINNCRPDNVLPLLQHHADPGIKTRDGRTALGIAESNLAAHTVTSFNHEDEEDTGWHEIVHLLKAAGAKK
jgi:ankyrin repeat protein